MAAPLTLLTAIGNYPHTRPLKDGTVTSQRLCFEHVEVNPANRAFRPMVNQLAYDVSELALVTLILARALGKQVVGVPVVLGRAGMEKVFEIELTADEQAAFDQSAAAVKELVDKLG